MYALLCFWLCASSAFALPHTKSKHLVRRKPASGTQRSSIHRVAGRHDGKSNLVVKPGYIFASLHGPEHQRQVGGNPPEVSILKSNSTNLTDGIPKSGKDAELVTGIFSGAKHARQLSGPFTLLHAINRCLENERLQHVLGKARERRMLKVHIIGVNASLEPAMAWAGILGGWNLKGRHVKTDPPEARVAMAKLAAEAALLRRDWQLAPAFSDVKLHLVFNGFEHREHRSEKRGIFDSSRCRQTAYAAGAMAGREGAVRLQCLVGKYGSKPVIGTGKRLPDLAVALNPSFGTEPAEWEDSINFLLDNEVPTLVTSSIPKKQSKVPKYWHAAQLRRMQRAQLPRPEDELEAEFCRGPSGVDMSSMSDARVLQRLGANIVEGYHNPFAYPSEAHHEVVKNGEALLFIGRKKDERSKSGSAAVANSSSSSVATKTKGPSLNHERHALIRDELTGMLSECKDHLGANARINCFRTAQTRIDTEDLTCQGSDSCKYGKIVPLFRNLIDTISCLADCQEYLNSLPHYFTDDYESRNGTLPRNTQHR
mmetsp:Transcript_70981/g.123118  ORF Transcript_70981/g.123118 Transcript_70981/m.123118 type:complete len:540 (-) Transcript_70981:214-1833(-)